MASPIVGVDFQYTIERETTFGTAVDSAPELIPTESMEINHDPQSHVLSRARGLRGDSEQDAWQDQVNAIPTASVGFYVSQATAEWFPAVLQDSTSYGLATNVRTMLTQNYSKLPSFGTGTIDSGHFYTLAAVSPQVARDEVITSAVGSSLKLSIAPDANEGALFAEIDFMGKSSAQLQTQTGTVSNPSMTYLYKWDNITSVTVNGTTVTPSFYSADITINNGAKFVPAGGSDSIALPKWEVSGSVTLLDQTAGTDAFMTSILNTAAGAANTVLEIEFGSGSMNADGDAKITVFGNLTGRSEDKSEEHQYTFDFVGLFGGATEFPFQFALYTETAAV